MIVNGIEKDHKRFLTTFVFSSPETHYLSHINAGNVCSYGSSVGSYINGMMISHKSMTSVGSTRNALRDSMRETLHCGQVAARVSEEFRHADYLKP